MLYLITRHSGAISWLINALDQHLELGNYTDDIKVLSHLEPHHRFAAGDIVVGILPVDKACQVVQQGARYFHLGMNLPAEFRGKELDAAQMQQFSPKIEEFLLAKPKFL